MLQSLPYTALNRVALALDRVRARLWFLSSRTSLRPLVVDKELRITTSAILQACLALALVLWCPSLVLVLGPLVLGVPHVASDVRYLVLRPRQPPGFAQATLVFSAVLVLLRLVETQFLGDPRFARLELGLVVVWVLASSYWFGLERGRALGAHSSVVLLGALVVGGLALWEPTLARLLFAHGHNVVGIVLWYALFRKRSRLRALPQVFVMSVALALVIWGGHLVDASSSWLGLELDAARSWLAPGLEPQLARGVVLSYAFLQSVHYAVWLLWIPQEACRSPGSTTFVMSLKSAWLDFGGLGLTAIGLGVLSVAVLGFYDPLTTSAVYLFITPFHGYLELVILVGWLARSKSSPSFVLPALAPLPTPLASSPTLPTRAQPVSGLELHAG